MVPSTSRIRGDRLLPEAGDESGLVVEGGGVSVEPLGGEHLVPVVADPATGPAIPAAARQAHRVGVGRSEERLGRRRAPVEQEPAPHAVGEAETPDVHGLRVVRADDVSEAQVQTEPAQGPQASSQPVDLQVAVHGLLAGAAGLPARGVETVRQVGHRLLEGPRDGREVLLVAGDQRRVGLRREVVGEVERAGGQGVHVISSDQQQPHLTVPARRLSGYGRRFCGLTGVLPQAPRCAIR